jgi:hypothetical protein
VKKDATVLATDTTAFGLIEMVLVFGLVLALAVWELVRVRRSLREDQSGRGHQAVVMAMRVNRADEPRRQRSKADP